MVGPTSKLPVIRGPRFLDGRSVSARPDPVDLTVVFPCFNEADRIDNILREWSHTLGQNVPSHEIVVINDGSSDGTSRQLDRLRKEIPALRVIHQLNAGPNRALLRGFQIARGNHTLFVQSNGCFEPSDFIRMWEIKKDFRLVSSYRTHRLDSFTRRFFSAVLRKLILWGFSVRVQDPESPFRLILTETAHQHERALENSVSSFLLCLGILIGRETPNLVTEIPVPYRKRPLGPVRRNRHYGLFRNFLRTGTDLFQLRVSLSPQRLGRKALAPIQQT